MNVALCDLDGTLVDTDQANFLAYQKAVKQVLGQSMSIPTTFEGRFEKADLFEVLPSLDHETWLEIVRTKNELADEFVDETVLNVNVLEQLKTWIQREEAFLVTRSVRSRAMSVLRYHGLLECFKGGFFAEDYQAGDSKYRHAMRCLKIQFKDVQVFENEWCEIGGLLTAGLPEKNVVLVK